jgi:hypothetical protein
MLTQRSTGGVIAVEITTGGAGYVQPPAVSFSGGGGTGAAAVATLSGKQVLGVVITNAGTGYTSAPTVSLSAATGSGAGATAAVYTGPAQPMSFFQGREGEVYGVDGMGRGVRIDCGATQALPIGLAPPSVGPAITASSTVTGQYVAAIHLTRQGAGYTQAPSITLTGGTPSTPAKAKAEMRDGSIRSVTVLEPGGGYQSPPDVTFAGGFPSGATFGATVSGGVAAVRVRDGGSGYSVTVGDPPLVAFSTAQGLTQALAVPSVDELGRISGVQLLSAGTGATTTGVTAAIAGGGGTGAVLAVEMSYNVTGATVINGGTGHVVPPVCSVLPAPTDVGGAGGVVVCTAAGGSVTGATISAGGSYSVPPQLEVVDTSAEAVAVLEPPVRGTYLCAYRFLDAEGVPSSISHLTKVEVPTGADNLLWTLSHAAPDSRATEVELWRTTADQAVVLYRVATLAVGTSTYTDTATDRDLIDAERAEFGFMPITLPSGQLNARRFGVPPGNYRVAAMFQDRAWFAGDTTGERPNSLLYSEVDEPESVPVENEIVLQENAGEHDTIVGLIPFGSELLIVQTGHIYALRYVAQPIIDASFALVAYRGAFNNACATVMGGVAFLADSFGVYAYDGRSERALSAPVDNYWRDGLIDFAQAAKFHLSADYSEKVVRFHYCAPGDTEPVRALCFCLATEAWWAEEYPVAVTASAPLVVGQQRTVAFGVPGGFRRFAAGPDPEGGIAWKYRSGNLTLANDPSRSIGVVYTPTAASSPLGLSLHYNGSTAARTLPVATDRGSGWANPTGGTVATLDMASSRSPLGSASGYAQAMFAGRLDPRSAGTDRHVAVAFAGTRTADPVVLHGVTVEGVT